MPSGSWCPYSFVASGLLLGGSDTILHTRLPHTVTSLFQHKLKGNCQWITFELRAPGWNQYRWQKVGTTLAFLSWIKIHVSKLESFNVYISCQKPKFSVSYYLELESLIFPVNLNLAMQFASGLWPGRQVSINSDCNLYCKQFCIVGRALRGSWQWYSTIVLSAIQLQYYSIIIL